MNQKILTVGYARESVLVCQLFGVCHEVGNLCTALQILKMNPELSYNKEV